MATATHSSPTGSRPRGTVRTPRPTPLSPGDLTQLRRMLDEQQRFRVEQLAALCAPGSAGPLASAVDEITRALAAGAQAALQDVRAALARMDAGRYGACTGCGAALDLARLEILPAVAQCMPCQRAARDALIVAPSG